MNLIIGSIGNILAPTQGQINISLPILSFANRVETSTTRCTKPITLQLQIPAGDINLDVALSEI